MHKFFETNKKYWDEAVDIHKKSELYSLDEFKKVGNVKPVYIKRDDLFDKNFQERMKKISKEITDKLIEVSEAKS